MHNPLSKETREVVWGSLIGDGGVFKDRCCRNSSYRESHSPKQYGYIKWKYDLLKPIMSSSLYSVTNFHKIRQKEYTTLQFVTKPHTYFSRLRKIFYPEGKKRIRRKILNRLTPLGLAVWFMDDGVFQKNNKNYPQLQISTAGFTLDENIIMQQYFKECWGIETRVHSRKIKQYPKTYYNLYFNKPNSLKLIAIIKPYIIPCMFYKIKYFLQPSSYPENNSGGRHSLN